MAYHSNSSEEAGELFKAQAHVWNHMLNYVNSMSLNCAIQLDIPDIINKHGKPMTLAELVDALPINKAKGQSVHRLMRMLVRSGFFEISKSDEKNDTVVEGGGYLLTPSSRLLLKDEPLSIRPLYEFILDRVMMTPWNSFSEWLRNDDATPFETAHGKTVFEYAEDNPTFNCMLNRAMASDSLLITSVMVKECKGVFEGINSIVDVGGGTGTVALAIADAFPHLQCTVFDLPHVVANLKGRNNLSYVAGDMFESIPNGDAVLLKWILHDWSDEKCLKILSRCREAIPSKENGGKVIIIDMVIDDGLRGDNMLVQAQLYVDMLLMVVTEGKERTEKEWQVLFKGAGFSDYKITLALGLRSVIELLP